MYKAKQFSEIYFRKKMSIFKLSFGMAKLLFVTFKVTTNDSFDDGFKLKSLILAQNERWRQA